MLEKNLWKTQYEPLTLDIASVPSRENAFGLIILTIFYLNKFK